MNKYFYVQLIFLSITFALDGSSSASKKVVRINDMTTSVGDMRGQLRKVGVPVNASAGQQGIDVALVAQQSDRTIPEPAVLSKSPVTIVRNSKTVQAERARLKERADAAYQQGLNAVVVLQPADPVVLQASASSAVASYIKAVAPLGQNNQQKTPLAPRSLTGSPAPADVTAQFVDNLANDSGSTVDLLDGWDFCDRKGRDDEWVDCGAVSF